MRDSGTVNRFLFTAIIGLLVGLLMVAVGQAAPAQAAPAQDKPKLAQVFVYSDPDEVSVEGVWRPDNLTKHNDVVEAVTSFKCFRHGGKDLVGTEAWCLQASAWAPSGMLDVSTDWLKVIEWSDTQIITTDDSSICLTSQTIFDLKRKTVIALDIRKPEAKGLFDTCKILPDRQTYFLQDKWNYFVAKASGRLPVAK
jgi:hypothetical protein